MTPKEFYLDTPLYTKIVISIEEAKEIVSSGWVDSFDGYNPLLKGETTFFLNYSQFDGGYNSPNFQIFTATLRCRRTDRQFYFLISYNKTKEELQKIGQLPSVADFHISEIKKFDKVISKEKQKEFTKAIGLAANGVGIGSFVYLRRIFEDLIDEAHNEFKKADGYDAEAFGRKRMGEKIDLMKDHLPEFLVENKEIYGVLSKGIHELEEQECLAYFDVMRVGIELILEDKLEKYQKQQKREEAKKKIAEAAQKINSKKTS